MSTESGIIIGISAATLLVSALGVFLGWLWHNATRRQNLESELFRIEDELKDIDVQIEREKSAGHKEMSHIYGIPHTSNPHIAEINALLERKEALVKRKKEIKEQLNQQIS